MRNTYNKSLVYVFTIFILRNENNVQFSVPGNGKSTGKMNIILYVRISSTKKMKKKLKPGCMYSL